MSFPLFFTRRFLYSVSVAVLSLAGISAQGCDDQPGPRVQPQTISVAGTNLHIRFRSNMPAEQRYINDQVMVLAARVAQKTGKDVTITSGYRNCGYNSKVAGVSHSMHLRALAVDFAVEGYDSKQLQDLATQVGASGRGSYSYCGNNYKPFAHMDLGKVRTWSYCSQK